MGTGHVSFWFVPFASVAVVGVFRPLVFGLGFRCWVFRLSFLVAFMALVVLRSVVFRCHFAFRCVASVVFLPSFGVGS